MLRAPSAKRHCRTLAVAAAVLTLSDLVHAVDSVPPEVLNVKVFADRYVVAKRSFASAAELHAWAVPIRLRALWLDDCTTGATRLLLAAVEQFHRSYTDGVVVRATHESDPGCAIDAPMANFGEMASRRASDDAGYLETDATGRSILP